MAVSLRAVEDFCPGGCGGAGEHHRNQVIYIYTYAHIYVYIYIYVHVYIDIYTDMCTYMYMYIYMCISMYNIFRLYKILNDTKCDYTHRYFTNE